MNNSKIILHSLLCAAATTNLLAVKIKDSQQGIELPTVLQVIAQAKPEGLLTFLQQTNMGEILRQMEIALNVYDQKSGTYYYGSKGSLAPITLLAKSNRKIDPELAKTTIQALITAGDDSLTCDTGFAFNAILKNKPKLVPFVLNECMKEKDRTRTVLAMYKTEKNLKLVFDAGVKVPVHRKIYGWPAKEERQGSLLLSVMDSESCYQQSSFHKTPRTKMVLEQYKKEDIRPDAKAFFWFDGNTNNLRLHKDVPLALLLLAYKTQLPEETKAYLPYNDAVAYSLAEKRSAYTYALLRAAWNGKTITMTSEDESLLTPYKNLTKKQKEFAKKIRKVLHPNYVKYKTLPCRKEAIKQILEEGFDPNTTINESGFAPLHYAVLEQDEEVMELLLDKGANPNRQSMFNISPREMSNHLSFYLPEKKQSENIKKIAQLFSAQK